MQLEPGMRVRCVKAGGNTAIFTGHEYEIKEADRSNTFLRVRGSPQLYFVWRFKPIVRVKMGRAAT